MKAIFVLKQESEKDIWNRYVPNQNFCLGNLDHPAYAYLWNDLSQ